jgi:phage gp29-like protein
MTSLALSPWTGRPLPPNSSLALARIAAAPPVQSARADAAPVPPDLVRLIRPQAMTRWILPQLAAITPTYIEQTLRGAFTGSHIQQWELFDLMEDTWPRLLKNLGEVKRAVIKMNWKIEPWAEEDMPPTPEAKERAKLVSTALWRMRPDPCCDENAFPETIRDILDAWGKGTSIQEILWEIRPAGQLGDITAPRATAWIHPSTYAWDTEGILGLNYALLERMANAPRRSLYNQAAISNSAKPGDLGPFPPDKFLIATYKPKTGSPLTTALLRPLAWWWCAANFSADWLMNLAQIFGLPFRWANYDSGASQAVVDKVCTMLENMGSAGWAAFPAGTTMELKEPGKTGDNSPQGDLLDRADKNCDLLILGQTLTSDTGGMGGGSGSMALGKVHQDVRTEVIEAAASFAASVVNQQLVPAILRLNYGNDEQCPEFRPESEKEIDQKGNADRDAVLMQAGVEMPKEWFYKRHEIPLPTEGEETISKPEPPPAPAPTDQSDPADPADTSDDPAYSARRAEILSAIHARFNPPTTRREKRELDSLARAVADDLAPMRARVEAILKIQDEAIFKTKLAEFNADLDALKADLGRDPKMARELERIIAAAFADGLRQPNR